jgi:Tol biopolymer transport system component
MLMRIFSSLLAVWMVGASALLTPAAYASDGGKSTGSTIVFQVSSGGAIYAVNPDGSGLRTLTHGMDPALSPDGQWVAFTRWDGVQDGITGSLWVINIDGSRERQIMSGAYQPKSPAWSADGTQVVINMQQGGRVSDAWMCMVDGAPTEVETPIEGQRCMPLRADPHWGLRVVDVATGAYEDLPHEAHSFAPTWDPVRERAWRIVYRGDKGLTNFDLNEGTTWLLKSGGAYRGPVFSPDGKKIAVTFKQNDHWEIHVMNADGSGEVRITETPRKLLIAQIVQGKAAQSWNNAAPAWSPDGSQIAFISDRNGSYEIFVMNSDGSGQRVLVSAAAMAGLKIQYDGVDERVIAWR